MTIEKPIVGSAIKNIKKLSYPLYASPKLDGIRCIAHPNLGIIARSFKPIPNDYIRECLAQYTKHSLDGELITYDNDGNRRTFNEVQGDVMSKSGKPNFKYHVFDCFHRVSLLFNTRREDAKKLCVGPHIEIIEHTLIRDYKKLQSLIDNYLSNGYEGVVTRSPKGLYKEGKCTLKDQWFLKYKEFVDTEGVITGFKPQELSSPCDYMTLGSLVLNTSWGEMSLAAGLKPKLRQEIWDNRELYINKIVKFKYQPSGTKNKPRFTSFVGFRDPIDLDKKKDEKIKDYVNINFEQEEKQEDSFGMWCAKTIGYFAVGFPIFMVIVFSIMHSYE